MSIKYKVGKDSENWFYQNAIRLLEENAGVSEKIGCIFKTPAFLLPIEISGERKEWYDKLFWALKKTAEQEKLIQYVFSFNRFISTCKKEKQILITRHIKELIPFESEIDLRYVYSEDFPSMILGERNGVVALKDPNTRAVILSYTLSDNDFTNYQKYCTEVLKGATKISDRELLISCDFWLE
ncbi:MAG: hypothetical protein J7L26_07660 [Candidatus Aminicenantes bacterium]|nr:hypothetical protein [Candidatus Aminicenantes bacterium]